MKIQNLFSYKEKKYILNFHCIYSVRETNAHPLAYVSAF